MIMGSFTIGIDIITREKHIHCPKFQFWEKPDEPDSNAWFLQIIPKSFHRMWNLETTAFYIFEAF